MENANADRSSAHWSRRGFPMSTSSMLLAVCIASVLLVLVYLRSRSDGIRLKPGPRAWPIIGHLHLLGKLPHRSLANLAMKYGPLMSLRLGNVYAVIVSSPDMAREILKNQDQVFASRPSTSIAEVFAHGRQNIVWAPYGPQWRFFRKVWSFSQRSASDTFSTQ